MSSAGLAILKADSEKPVRDLQKLKEIMVLDWKWLRYRVFLTHSHLGNGFVLRWGIQHCYLSTAYRNQSRPFFIPFEICPSQTHPPVFDWAHRKPSLPNACQRADRIDGGSLPWKKLSICKNASSFGMLPWSGPSQPITFAKQKTGLMRSL